MVDREEEINRRIEKLKRKNEALLQRHKEVEADKKSAEKGGQTFRHKQTHLDVPKERGTAQRSRAHMDMDECEQDQSDDRNRRRTPRAHRGRGIGPATAHETHRGTSRGRGRGAGRVQDYEAKRMENFRLMEEEFGQTFEENEEPSSSGVSRFLDDPRRRGDLEPEQRWKSTRHRGNYGGVEFDNVKRGMRGRGRGGYNNRGHGRGRGMSRLQMSAEFTGRERRDQERWQAMRDAADKEIMARSKNTRGNWRREWDSEKKVDFDMRKQESGGGNRYEEPDQNYRGGRGRRGINRTRRGSRTSHGSADHSNEHHKEELVEKEGLPAEESSGEVTDKPAEENDPRRDGGPVIKEDPKVQRPRKKQKGKSPRHLVQQRAQTPSSKDGTEVWAQNSHHSDETGPEWKNGASRSVEQWLPSDEGNRNPAIDERMLEQQEDGATAYSQQLGRGWGSEKNIKAAKAWVIDTEKAGATKQKPVPDHIMETGESKNNEKNFGKMHTGRRAASGKKEDSRVKEVRNERTEARSLSPKLKRGNPGLTVEIRKGAGDRRVKRYSEGDSIHPGSESKDVEKSDAVELASSPPVTSPLSAEFLKTPEGMKHVDDWATEMDMQSPTYESRQKNLEKALAQTTANELEVAAKSDSKPPTSGETVSATKDAQENETVIEADKKVTGDIVLEPNNEPPASQEADSCKKGSTGEEVVDVEIADPDKENAKEPVMSSSDATAAPEPEATVPQPLGDDRPQSGKESDDEPPAVSEITSTTTVSDETAVVENSTTKVANEATDIQNEGVVQPVASQTESARNSVVTAELAIQEDESLTEEKSDLVAASRNELDPSNMDGMDSNFKDAEEDVDDEFYECDENETELDTTDKLNEDSNIVSRDTSGKVEGAVDSKEATEPAATVASEEICTAAKETVRQRLRTPPEVNGVESKTDNDGATDVSQTDAAEPDKGANEPAVSENVAHTS